MKNVNLTFWVKAISLAANFSSTRSASTSIDHKQKIEFFYFLKNFLWLTLVEADLVEPKLAAKEIAFSQKLRLTFSFEI